MVKRSVQEHTHGSDTGKLEQDIHALKVIKLHSKKSEQLARDTCHKVISLIDTRHLVFVDPEDIKKRARYIKEGKKRKNPELQIFNADKGWKEGAMVRMHFSPRSFLTSMIRGYAFQNPSDDKILAAVYTYLEDPDKEYIIIDSAIVGNSLGADFLITALREKYKTIWGKTHSS